MLVALGGSMSQRWIVSTLVAVGCGGNASTSPFTAAQVTVDHNKLMNALTSDEQTTLCDELTQSLSASFGTRDVECELGSHSGTREGKSTCQGWYDDCLASTPATSTVPACTSNNDDMFACAITVGAYSACFNATNAFLLRTIESVPACEATEANLQPTADEMAACVNAACDYVWFD
jgi:hypothetical protein